MADLAVAIEATQTPEFGPQNPFYQPSALPFQAPPFDRIADTDYEPAFLAGMAEQMEEVQAIIHNSEPPTFENTIVALERSGAVSYTHLTLPTIYSV